jgi:hypothetical protein
MDLKRIYKYLKYWPLFVVFLLLSLGAAFCTLNHCSTYETAINKY